MIYSDLRVCLYIVYAALLVWLGSRNGVDARAFFLLVGFVVIRHALYGLEWLHRSLAERVARNAFLALDVQAQRDLLEHTWLAVTRQFFRDAVDEAGQPVADGAIETFPFPATRIRENTIAFWLVAALAFAALVTVFTGRSLPSGAQWTLWTLGFLSAGLLAAIMSRAKHLRSRLEISPFALSLVAADGTRRTFQWSATLAARNHWWRRRVDVYCAGHAEPIPLDYGRLGFTRICGLVRRYALRDSQDAA